MHRNDDSPSQAIVGLMAKHWHPGRVKTRLGASIGMDRAADLHELFVHHLLGELKMPAPEWERGAPEAGQGRAEERNWALQWIVSPPDSMDQCRQQVKNWNLDTVTIADQGDGDLGDRMGRWFHRCNQQKNDFCGPKSPSDSVQESHNSGYAKAILIGADCPLLNCNDITDALQRLDRFDAVLGPAVDGGYFLIGLNCPPCHDFRRIFTNMVWSREDVFEMTLQRMEQIGMTVSILPTREDVDTHSELKRLRQSLTNPHFEHDETTERLRDEMDRVMGTFNET